MLRSHSSRHVASAALGTPAPDISPTCGSPTPSAPPPQSSSYIPIVSNMPTSCGTGARARRARTPYNTASRYRNRRVWSPSDDRTNVDPRAFRNHRIYTDTNSGMPADRHHANEFILEFQNVGMHPFWHTSNQCMPAHNSPAACQLRAIIISVRAPPRMHSACQKSRAAPRARPARPCRSIGELTRVR